MSAIFNDDLDDILAGAGISKPVAKLKSVATTQEEIKPRPETLSEDDLADRFVSAFGHNWRWVPEWAEWMHYDDLTGWRRETSGLIEHCIKEFCREILATLPQCQKLSLKDRRAIGGGRLHRSVRDMIKVHRDVVTKTSLWDANPWMIGTPAGPINLKDGKQAAQARDHYITRSTVVNPDFTAPHPLWDKFLDSMTVKNADLYDYLHRLSGLSLTGDTSDEAFSFLFGGGQNGKGVFLHTIMGVLGGQTASGYAAICNYTTFFENKHGEGHAEEIARLDGMRLVAVTETPKGVAINEARIKSFTGGDMITARRMRESTFQFKPQFKLVILGNFKPIIKGVGPAMARRMHLIPCLAVVPVEERNNNLKAELEAEYPAIMAWMIRGLEKWKKDRLTPPDVVKAATTNFLESEDVVEDWVSDRCSQEGRTVQSEAYKDFKEWCKDQGKDYHMSDRSFYEDMETKGFVRKKSNGLRYLMGVTVKPREEKPREWFADKD